MKNRRKTKKTILKDGLLFRLGILAVSLILLLLIWINREELVNLSRWGYLGIFIVNFVSNATVIFPVPGAASVFFGGAIWNPFVVGLFSGTGAAMGELFAYFIGFGSRGIFKNHIKKKPWIKNVEKYFQQSGFLTVLIFSALPLPVFDVIGLLAGSLNYPVVKFFLATLTGRILRNTIFAWMGARVLPM